MTRQKKEIMRQIKEIQEFIAVDEELGCGFAPAGAYDELYQQIDQLEVQLAKLSHYDSVMDMYMDTRYIDAHINELPFI